MFGEGISFEADIINLGQKYDLVKRTGNTYTYGNEKLGVGIDNARMYLIENKKTANTIVKEIRKAARES